MEHEVSTHPFFADPRVWLEENLLDCQQINKTTNDVLLAHHGQAKILKANNGYQLQPCGTEDTDNNDIDTVRAYFLGSLVGCDLRSDPQSVDIPRIADEGYFLFTQTFTAGSLIVLPHPTDPAMYRVIRDERLEGSLLYDDVVMAVDFVDYAAPGSAVGMAAICMHFRAGKWCILVQRQMLSEYSSSSSAKLSIHPQFTATDQQVPATVTLIDTYDRPFNSRRFAEHLALSHGQPPKGSELAAPDLLGVELTADLSYGTSSSVMASLQPLPLINLSESQKRDQELQIGAKMIEANRAVGRWRAVVAVIKQREGLGEDWIPVVASVKPSGKGMWEMKFRDSRNPKTTRLIRTPESTISQFSSFVAEQVEIIKQGYEFEKGRFKHRDPAASPSSLESIKTSQSLVVIQTITKVFTLPPPATPSTPSKSSTTMKQVTDIHGWAEYLHTSLVGNLATLAGEKAGFVGSEVARDLRSLSIFGEGIGVLLGGVGVGLDVYEMVVTTDRIGREVVGVKLALDSAGVVIGTFALGAGLVGAATAATLLGGAGTIVGGLAVGISELAKVYGGIATRAAAVGRYFVAIDKAYEDGGYAYDAKNEIMTSLDGAVITKIDLLKGRVEFGSQMIYRTQHGSTGSGKIGYFFWGGDKPVMVRDRSQAINIREGIGRAGEMNLNIHGSMTTIVLPSTPTSCISYGWSDLPGATTRHDPGFDLIRKLEQDYRFDFDFYIFPLEQIIADLTHTYETTPVRIVLSSRSVRLQVPALRWELRSSLEYTLEGAEGQYTIGPSYGGIVTLESSAGHQPRWIFDFRGLSNRTILRIAERHLEIAGMTIYLSDRRFASVWIIDEKNEITDLNCDTLERSIIQEDGSQWPSNEGLLLHLREEAAKRGPSDYQYITTDNYSLKIDGKMTNVGRAFYDCKNDRMLYTYLGHNAFPIGDAVLGPVVDNRAYFFNNQGVWLVDVSNGHCLRKYCSYFEMSEAVPTLVREQGLDIIAQYKQEINGGTRTLVYRLTENSMELMSIAGEPAMLDRLRDLTKLTSLDELIANNGKLTHAKGMAGIGSLVLAKIHCHMFSVLGTDSRGLHQRYWLRERKDGSLELIGPNLEPNTPVPTDLVLAGSLQPGGGSEEVFYFYTHGQLPAKRSETQKPMGKPIVYRRVGTINRNNHGLPLQVPERFSSLSSLGNVNGFLFAYTDTGYILRLNVDGSFVLGGVNNNWFSSRGESWWTELDKLAKREGLMDLRVLAVKSTGTPTLEEEVPIWYHNSRIVIASPRLHSKQIQLIGINGDGTEAWLHHVTDLQSNTGHLYRQRLLSPDELRSVTFRNGMIDIPDGTLPEPERMFIDLGDLGRITKIGKGFEMTTIEGYILAFGEKELPVLLGIDMTTKHPGASSLHTLISDAELRTLAKCNKWRHREVIAIRGLADSTPCWYHVSTEWRATAKGISWLDGPVWLGMAVGNTRGFVHLEATGGLYQVTASHAERIGAVTFSHHYNNTLVLAYPITAKVIGQPRGNLLVNDISIPTLTNSKFIMFSSDGGGNTYHITQQNWDHYEAIIIDNWNENGFPDSVRLEITQPTDLLVRKDGESLVIFDPTNSKSLTITKACGTDQAYRKLHVDISSTVSLTMQCVGELEGWTTDDRGLRPVDSAPQG